MFSRAPLCTLALLSLAAMAGTAPAQSVPAPSGIRYPVTRAVPVLDTLHGTPVADPYRWLENTASSETREWIQAQNAVTQQYLAAIPERPRIRERLTELWNHDRYGAPFRRGGLYFYWHHDGLKNQPVLVGQRGLDGRAQKILDVNTLSGDGTVSVSTVAVSENARYLAYAVSTAGSDWREIRIRDLRSGRDVGQPLRHVKFSSIAWTRDERGFFYSRYDAPSGADSLLAVNSGQKLYYHRLGTRQSDDLLIWDGSADPTWLISAQVTEDGFFAVLTLSQGTDRRTRIHLIDLSHPTKPRVTNPIVRLVDDFDAQYVFSGSAGAKFVFRTDLTAARGRVIVVDLNNRMRRNWTTLVPELPETLADARYVGGRIVTHHMRDAASVLRIYSTDGDLEREIRLPGLGSVGALWGEGRQPELFWSFTSYLHPSTVYRADVRRDTEPQVFRQPSVKFDPERYETRQVFFRSRDGTRVPMFVTHRKGLALDGTNPTLLYGYGGFNISMTPGFSASRVVWLEMGGVYAVVNLRGGGEYGQSWHEAGMRERKQNVFDDFVGAAEHLIAEGFTSPAKLGIQGGSNGGLLVGAVMNQRPELFGVALPAVGVMDMLRFHHFTIGWAWVPEYGTADDPEDFEVLRRYSPLHNLQPGTRYPATLVTTADHDDRVVPGHSFKYAAALQAAQAAPAPVLIRVETRAGHGAGRPVSMIIDATADELAFAAHNLGMGALVP